MIPPARQNSSKGTTPAALGERLKGQDAMLISEDYKQLAERCMKLASECSDPIVAAALGPCDRLFGACRWPRWSRPRPFLGIGRPQGACHHRKANKT